MTMRNFRLSFSSSENTLPTWNEWVNISNENEQFVNGLIGSLME